MARREPPWHERTTALDNSMEPADRTDVAPTGPSDVAEPLCAAPARRDVSWAPLQEIAESAVRAKMYLSDQLSWCCPTMEERLVTLHNDIDEAFETYALCAGRNALTDTALRNHLAWLLGDSLLEGAFDHDADDRPDDLEDTWDDETTWGKGSTTTPTTATSGVQPITTPPQLITTPPHIFRSGGPAPPNEIHVDAGVSAMTLNYPADEGADSTADDCASAERRAGFTANGRADSIITTDVNTLPVALEHLFDDVRLLDVNTPTTLSFVLLYDALKDDDGYIDVVGAKNWKQHGFNAVTNKVDNKVDRTTQRDLKEKFEPVAGLPRSMKLGAESVFPIALANYETSAAPVSSSPETDDAQPVPKGASTSALRVGPDAQRRPPGPNGRRRTATPVRRRPLGTRLFERPSPLGSNALPVPVLPPGSHPAPPPPPEPPPTHHPADRARGLSAMTLNYYGSRSSSTGHAHPTPAPPPGSHLPPPPPPEPPPTQHPADRHAPPTPAPPPGSHPAPLPPPEPPPVHRPTCRHAPRAPEPPPGSHPAPLPPPEPPPVQHPAPPPHPNHRPRWRSGSPTTRTGRLPHREATQLLCPLPNHRQCSTRRLFPHPSHRRVEGRGVRRRELDALGTLLPPGIYDDGLRHHRDRRAESPRRPADPSRRHGASYRRPRNATVGSTRRRRLPIPLHPYPTQTHTDGSPKREPGPAAALPRAASEHTDHDSADTPGYPRHSSADGQLRPADDWAHLANVGALAQTKTLPCDVLGRALQYVR